MPLEISNIDVAIATSFVQLVLNCIDKEYPHSNLFWFDSDEDIKPPRQRTPAFYGCLEWHSSVHGHWLLVRLCRYFPEMRLQKIARLALTQSLKCEKIQGEVAHLQRCPFFECPYGFAWLLQLAAELREWDDPQATEWAIALEPLETQITTNFHCWLQELDFPDRTGSHFNTAFALSLALDWAKSQKNREVADLIKIKAQQFYLRDRNYPLQIEPLAYDFISPALAKADLMRRILSPLDFANWLTDFLPQLLAQDSDLCLQPIQVANNNYLQSHFRGLNLSRAWMLEGILSGLPVYDARLDTLRSIAVSHRQYGLSSVDSNHYASSHWLGTFAVYLVTARGLCG